MVKQNHRRNLKERFRKHTKSFNNRRYQNETELSKSIWILKHQNKTPKIKWKIIQVTDRKVKLNLCKLCLREKYYIINAFGNPSLLYKRSEFVNNCRPDKIFLLAH